MSCLPSNAATGEVRSPRLFFPLLALVLGACSSTKYVARPEIELQSSRQPNEQQPSSSGRSGGFYKDDGPGDRANRPYEIDGSLHIPMRQWSAYRVRGTASWYGRRYHGRNTSNGEIYDMYAMSAAHRVLPLPSFARVTHLASGRSVVVRVNDRGPFIGEREIDLSYAAAQRLGIVRQGAAEVEIELLLPGKDY
ncbi:MAG: septal ring lytic transglycosylase RlpA family protein [Betaproteobacteria bacterium]|nr:septal ring lytic transglycosylase RlpA family protein [Betaproteobacteria bacterium]